MILWIVVWFCSPPLFRHLLAYLTFLSLYSWCQPWNKRCKRKNSFPFLTYHRSCSCFSCWSTMNRGLCLKPTRHLKWLKSLIHLKSVKSLFISLSISVEFWSLWNLISVLSPEDYVLSPHDCVLSPRDCVLCPRGMYHSIFNIFLSVLSPHDCSFKSLLTVFFSLCWLHF